MGTYDNVNYKCECPGCGKTLKDFQTKDGAREFKTVEPKDIDYFYDYCQDDGCNTWVDIYVTNKEPLELNVIVNHEA